MEWSYMKFTLYTQCWFGAKWGLYSSLFITYFNFFEKWVEIFQIYWKKHLRAFFVCSQRSFITSIFDHIFCKELQKTYVPENELLPSFHVCVHYITLICVIYISISIYLSTNLYIYMYIYVHTYYIHIYKHIYIYIYMYI